MEDWTIHKGPLSLQTSHYRGLLSPLLYLLLSHLAPRMVSCKKNSMQFSVAIQRSLLSAGRGQEAWINRADKIPTGRSESTKRLSDSECWVFLSLFLTDLFTALHLTRYDGLESSQVNKHILVGLHLLPDWITYLLSAWSNTLSLRIKSNWGSYDLYTYLYVFKETFSNTAEAVRISLFKLWCTNQISLVIKGFTSQETKPFSSETRHFQIQGNYYILGNTYLLSLPSVSC